MENLNRPEIKRLSARPAGDEKGAPESAPPSCSDDRSSLPPTNQLLGTLSILLLIVLIVGGILSAVMLNQHVRAIEARDDVIEQLGIVNVEFIELTDQLVAERNELGSTAENLTEELNGMTVDYEEIGVRVGELESELEESDRQLTQAREEESRQVELADEYEEIGTYLYLIVTIDEEILAEYESLTTEVAEMNRHVQNNELNAASASYQRVQEILDRVDELYLERDEVIENYE